MILVRIHPGDVGPRWDQKKVQFTADKRVPPGSFMMLVKGNATEGTEDAEKTPQAEA